MIGVNVRLYRSFSLLKYHLTRFNGVVPGIDNRFIDMHTFSKISAERLAQCDTKLQALFNEVIAFFDCAVLCGHRGKEEQDAAVAAGKSKTPFPQSKHNLSPSKAADVAPFYREGNPVDWNDRERLTLFAGFVLGVAQIRGIPIRWGGDWDQDTEVKDNSFDDLVHFELVD